MFRRGLRTALGRLALTRGCGVVVIPLVVLASTSAVLWVAGLLGVAALEAWESALRGGLVSMLLLTASAHFGRRRPGLVAMVPPRLPKPGLLVTLTGIFEVVIAAALLHGTTADAAGAALAVLLVAVFPANVHATRAHVRFDGKPATALLPRTVIQALFIAAALSGCSVTERHSIIPPHGGTSCGLLF